MQRLAVFSSFLLVLSCKSADEAKPNADKPNAATAPVAEKTVAKAAPAPAPTPGEVEGKQYDEGLAESACELLTAEMISTVSKIPADAIKQRAPSGMCLYQWEGGTAGIAFIKVYSTPTEAAEHFTRSHKLLAPGEAKPAMHGAASGHGKPAVDVEGEITKSMGGSVNFEAVSDLGDQAAYDATRHESKVAHTTLVSYGNKLDVRVGNLAFGVSFALDAEDHVGTMQKDEAIALARLVLEPLL